MVRNKGKSYTYSTSQLLHSWLFYTLLPKRSRWMGNGDVVVCPQQFSAMCSSLHFSPTLACVLHELNSFRKHPPAPEWGPVHGMWHGYLGVSALAPGAIPPLSFYFILEGSFPHIFFCLLSQLLYSSFFHLSLNTFSQRYHHHGWEAQMCPPLGPLVLVMIGCFWHGADPGPFSSLAAPQPAKSCHRNPAKICVMEIYNYSECLD